MQPTFDQYHESVGAELECPGCGNNDLHHECIEVFDRSEDEPKGLHVTVNGGSVNVDTDLKGNPSARRHGLAIHFSCEHCKAKPVLTIAQHKGKTYVDLRNDAGT